jgi:hypothetical protein
MVAGANPCQRTTQGSLVKNARERMDVVAAYREASHDPSGAATNACAPSVCPVRVCKAVPTTGSQIRISVTRYLVGSTALASNSAR